MISTELKRRTTSAYLAYSKALDRQIASKRVTSAAWENYEQRHQDYTESLLETQDDS